MIEIAQPIPDRAPGNFGKIWSAAIAAKFLKGACSESRMFSSPLSVDPLVAHSILQSDNRNRQQVICWLERIIGKWRVSRELAALKIAAAAKHLEGDRG